MLLTVVVMCCQEHWIFHFRKESATRYEHTNRSDVVVPVGVCPGGRQLEPRQTKQRGNL